MNNACINGNIEQIKLFQKYVKFDPWSIIYAIQHDQFETVKYLCNNNAPINANAIYNSVAYNNYEITKYLYEFGAPVDKWIVYYSANFGSQKITKYLLYAGAPFTQPIEYISELCKEIKTEYTNIISEFLIEDIARLICEYSIFFNKI